MVCPNSLAIGSLPQKRRAKAWIGWSVAVRKKDLIESVKKRVPFRVAQKLLREAGLPSGKTWDSIQSKIADENPKGKLFHDLYDTYTNFLVAYDKSVAIYKVGAKVRASVLNLALQLIPDGNNVLVQRYPYAASDNTLSKYSEAFTEFVAIESLGDATAFVFSTVQVLDQRERIPASKVHASVAKTFYEIIGIKKTYNHSYDAVIIPHHGEYIWLCADDPKYTNANFSDFAHISVRKKFNELVGAKALSKPVNLFPIISKIYGTPSEGVVLSLSHVTSTGSVKREHMRNGTCLRTELFHSAGVKAVGGSIDSFAIGITWPVAGEDGDEFIGPELYVDGDAKDVGKIDPVVDAALIKKCVDAAALREVVDKIISYLPLDGTSHAPA